MVSGVRRFWKESRSVDDMVASSLVGQALVRERRHLKAR
jgi:hypothetical protein